MNVLALDVSMGHSYYVLYQDEECLFEGVLEHNQLGFSTLLKLISQFPSVPDIVFESTGIYSKVIETFCQNNGFDYYLLNPLEAKKQTEENTLRSWKTDKSDAHKLAISHFEKKKVRTIFVKQEAPYLIMRDLSRFYQEIEKQIKQLRMSLHNCLQLTFPELELLFTNRVSTYSLILISSFPHPELVKASSRTKIKNQLLKNTKKKMAESKAWTKADQLIEYAQSSYPSVGVDSIYCQKVIYYAEKLLDLLIQKENLTQQMIDSAQVIEEFSLYQTFPGVGALTSALLIGELGNIKRFKTTNQLNAFVGIDIRRYQSGKFTGKDHINKRGNPKARKILFYTIKNMVRQQKNYDNHIVDYYYKLKKQPVPKKDKVATVACINKLLKCMHSMVRNHTEYAYAYTASKCQSL